MLGRTKTPVVSVGPPLFPLYQYFGRDPCSRKASLVMAPILKMFCIFRTKFSFSNHRPFKKNISAFLFDTSSVLTVGNPEWFLIKTKQNKKTLQQPSFKIVFDICPTQFCFVTVSFNNKLSSKTQFTCLFCK